MYSIIVSGSVCIVVWRCVVTSKLVRRVGHSSGLKVERVTFCSLVPRLLWVCKLFAGGGSTKSRVPGAGNTTFLH